MSDAKQASDAGAVERPARSGVAALWEQVSTFLLAIIIALGIRAFIIEPYRIPSGSMFPTLLIGDHIFVNKFIYGVKIPFTDVRLPGLREPRRGDVVVFTVGKDRDKTVPVDRQPKLPTEQFVKRIVGLPGDEIQIKNDQLYVNGEQVETTALPEEFVDDHGRRLHQHQVRMGSHEYVILDDPVAPYARPSAPFTVEEGRYFMLGDNRDYSKDSRYWGTVRLAEIKGPAFILYWSWNFNGSWAELINPLTWFDLLTNKMRWDRIGDGVD